MKKNLSEIHCSLRNSVREGLFNDKFHLTFGISTELVFKKKNFFMVDQKMESFV